MGGINMTSATKEAPKNNGEKIAVPAKTAETPLALTKRDFVDVVAQKVKGFLDNGELFLPKNYSPDNALKSAWLLLQGVEDKDHNPALKVCTRDSIANTLLDMIVQGLNPGKRQCYFIVYGKTLTCQRSYFGSMAVAQMVEPRIGEFAYAVVYEGDVFKYGIKNGKKIVSEHTQDLDNVDKKKIKGAYCIALDKSGEPMRTEIMTIAEIHQAWKQSKMNPFDEKGNVKDSSTHGKFSNDMALKTVINKTCKLIINASSDNSLLLERINRADELTDTAVVQAEIEEGANTGEVLEIEAEQHAESGGEIREVSEEEMQKQAEEGVKELSKRAPGF
jgi:recombination protein RecT